MGKWIDDYRRVQREVESHVVGDVQPHFGKRVMMLLDLLRSKCDENGTRDDDLLNDAYTYLYEDVRWRIGSLLTCHEDNESRDFLFDMVDHFYDVKNDRLDFLCKKQQWFCDLIRFYDNE